MKASVEYDKDESKFVLSVVAETESEENDLRLLFAEDEFSMKFQILTQWDGKTHDS